MAWTVFEGEYPQRKTTELLGPRARRFLDKAAVRSVVQPARLVCWITAPNAVEAGNKAQLLFAKFYAEQRIKASAELTDLVSSVRDWRANDQG